MFSLLVLTVFLFTIPNALSIPRTLDVRTRLSVRALGPQTQLYVVNGYIAPDGYNRSATLVNGVFPGPLIQANKNDRFLINVNNELADSNMPLGTSVHWHGLFQSKSNWADGTSSVTQCPIQQNVQFLYNFTTNNQTGTYWYHSHFSDQYCDGLRGPVVIYDPQDPLAYLYDVDDETTVITLSDWYHSNSITLGGLSGPVYANSTLINGLGRYPGGPETSLAVVKVTLGSRYRFRLVGMSCKPSFNFSIDGHRLTVIEVDGNEVDPVEVDSLPVLAGQRYSVVVTANQTVGNYWIRALSDLPNATFEGGQSSAILRYAGAPDKDPASPPGPYELSFDEGSLHPLVDPAAPGIPGIGNADVSLLIQPGFLNGNFTLNNVSYVDPSVPVLLQILSGAKHASQLLPNGSVYVLPSNKVIEISFPNPPNAPGGPHPIHLHGHAFSVVKIAGSNIANFVNPVRRDVVSLGNSPTDNVTIRFVTDNAGPWFLHCHISWHQSRGFAVVLAEAPALAAEQQGQVVPEEWYDLCPANLTYTGY